MVINPLRATQKIRKFNQRSSSQDNKGKGPLKKLQQLAKRGVSSLVVLGSTLAACQGPVLAPGVSGLIDIKSHSPLVEEPRAHFFDANSPLKGDRLTASWPKPPTELQCKLASERPKDKEREHEHIQIDENGCSRNIGSLNWKLRTYLDGSKSAMNPEITNGAMLNVTETLPTTYLMYGMNTKNGPEHKSTMTFSAPPIYSPDACNLAKYSCGNGFVLSKLNQDWVAVTRQEDGAIFARNISDIHRPENDFVENSIDWLRAYTNSDDLPSSPSYQQELYTVTTLNQQTGAEETIVVDYGRLDEEPSCNTTPVDSGFIRTTKDTEPSNGGITLGPIAFETSLDGEILQTDSRVRIPCVDVRDAYSQLGFRIEGLQLARNGDDKYINFMDGGGWMRLPTSN